MSIPKEHSDTAAAWEVTAAIYEREEAEDIVLLKQGNNRLLAPERERLGNLRPWCRRAIHLQCAGGVDTLALWQLGAAEVVGIDISPRMLVSAKQRSAAVGAPATWYCCDVLATPPQFDGTADLVYTGKGALPWMMDLGAWAAVVQRLLQPGGRLYVFEGHPLDWVWDFTAASYQFDPRTGDYFSQSPLTNRGWPMLSDAVQAHPAKDELRVHEHQWTLGQLLNSLVEAGLQLEHFAEYPDLYWNQFPHLPPDLARRLPHTFGLLMRKP
ncbi:MAG: class I SAM-dependent methyltransferase [Herpetosiphonaceae bacterium]|nr:class I SAM-dependent methyltransferase [Herpetosiphonaceae bacterium]